MSVKTDKTKAVTFHTHTHTHTQSPPHLFPSLSPLLSLLPLPTVPLCKSKDLPRVLCRRQKTIDSFNFSVTFAGDEGVEMAVLLYLLYLLYLHSLFPSLPSCYPHLGSSSLPAPQRDTCVGCVRFWSGPEPHLPAPFLYSPYSPPVPLMAMANKSLTECLMCERPRAASPEAVMAMTTAWLSGKLPLPHPLQLTLCSAPALLLPLPLTLYAVPSYHIDLRGIPTGCRPLNATHTRFLSFPLVSLGSLVRFWFFQKHYSFVRFLYPVTLSVPS